MPEKRNVFLFFAALLSVVTSSDEISKNIDCQPNVCIPSNFSHPSEVKWTTSLVIKTKGNTIEDYESSVAITVDVGETPSYLSHTLTTSDERDEYFHVNSGLWISQLPLLGNGFLHSISLNISHGGVIQVYSLSMYDQCNRFNMFWRCLENSDALEADWGEDVSSAIDELEYLSASLLEDTFYVVDDYDVPLTNTGDQDEIVDFLVQKGHYIGFESVNATLYCNSFEPIDTIVYTHYETPTSSKLAPFFTLHFRYKAYQPYVLKFKDEITSSLDYETVDISKHSVLNATDGTLSISRSLTGYFSSYTMILEIPQWDVLYNNHDAVSFNFLAIIDGNLGGMPNTSRSLNNIMNMPPPITFHISNSIITYPDTKLIAYLKSGNDKEALFKTSIISYRWNLVVLPSETPIKFSSKKKFSYNDLVMPGNYRLTLEFDTNDNVTFSTFSDIEYVSDAFTFIRCLFNCDPSFTTGYADLHLSVDVPILSKVNYEVVSAKWSVVENDNGELITDNVTLFDDLVELSVDTSMLTKKYYVVNLVIVTAERNITIHDDYLFNMSYPEYILDCSVEPSSGISLQTLHNIICEPVIDNIKCSLCENSDSTLCNLCSLNYKYYFKSCLDHGKCQILSPLTLGSLAQPILTGIYLPVGNENENFNLTVVVCMYDNKGNVEYVHKLVSVTSLPDPLLKFDVILGDISPGINNSSTDEEVFQSVQKVGAALSHGEINETVQNQLVEFLKKVEQQHNDVSMAMFSVLYPLSQMKVNDVITSNLSSITNITYQSIQNAPKEVAESASKAMLSIMWNVLESNAEISNVQTEVPELNLYFVTESPDKAYYNKWVDFDIEEESQTKNDTTRSNDLCSTLQTLQDYVAKYLQNGAGIGKVSSLDLPNVHYSIARLTAAILLSGNQLVGKTFLKVPPPQFIDVLFTDTLSISFVKFTSNPCILTENSDRIKSFVIGLNITDSASPSKIVVEDFETPLEVLIPLKGAHSLREFIYNPDYNWLYLQLDIFTEHHSVLFLEILTTRATTLLIKHGSLPKILDHDFRFEFPNSTADKVKEEKLHDLGFSPRQNSSTNTLQVPIKSNGTFFVGVRVDGTKVRRFWLLAYVTSCLKWTGSGWLVSSDNVGILSNSTTTHCKFNELSMYAADLNYPELTEFKKPEPEEDQSLSRVLDALKIWLPLIVVYGYLLLTFTLVLRLCDRDLRSSNLLHLLSSERTEHSYKIEVRTGLRPKAGTTSQVYLELHGSKATRKIKIEQKNGELFETNQTSTFLFYSDINIGRIDRINIWIDYIGNRPDWFLESVRITNSNDRVYMFIYHNWIGYDIEKYVCSIPRFRPSEISLFKRLTTCWTECLVNYHTGLSNLFKGTRIFPLRTYLTSLFVLRCLTLLCLVVVTFEDSVHDHISLAGSLKLTFLLFSTYPVFFILEKSQEILCKNERYNFLVKKMLNRHESDSSIFSFDIDKYFWVTAPEKGGKKDGKYNSLQNSVHYSEPSQCSLDEYFRLTATVKPNDSVTKNEPLKQADKETLLEFESVGLGDAKRKVKVDDYFRFFWDDASSVGSSDTMSSLNFDVPLKPLAALPNLTFKFYSKMLKNSLAILSYIGIITTTCFYLFYTYTSNSIHMDTCLMYYLMIMVLFLFVEQPLVCGVITLIYSRRLWYGISTPDSHCDTLLNEGEAAGNLTQHPEIRTWDRTVSKRRKMNTIITKLFSYITFIIIVVVLSKHDRQTNCFYLNKSVRSVFATPAFDAIETKDNFWSWIQNDYSSTLSSEDFYEDTRTRLPKEKYLRDSSSFIISISRLKQVRIKPTTCLTNKKELCNEGYSSSLIEKTNFDPSWKVHTPAADNAWFSTIRYKSYWQYKDGKDGVAVKGHSGLYPTGGYQVPLANSPINAKKQLKMLEQDGWIDELTRAVLVELSVYNPPTGFLCTVKLITEFLPTGTAVSDVQLHSINFLKYSKPITLSIIRTELLFLISLLILTVHYIYLTYRAHSDGHPVWRGFWSLLDSVTLLAGWMSVAMYIYRYVYIQTAIVQFQATPYYYIDFHRAAEVDIYFGYCLGSLVFLVTVKIVDLTIAHVKIKLMTLVIHNSLVELSSFGVPFFILLAVFSQTFYFLYSSSMPEFSSQNSFGMTLAFILGEYNWDAMMRLRPYLTPFLGLLLGLLSVTYLANMFAVIVCYNTTYIRMNPPTSQHLAIFGYLTKTIKNMVFFVVPLLDDVYTLVKRNMPGGSGKYRNPYYKTISSEGGSSNDSLHASEVEIQNVPPATPAAGTVIQKQSESIKRMRSKLKRQTKTLGDLNNLLNCVESRLKRITGC